jgi:5-bromo-4-chloroindolyl phosphate hydrolysis protein
VHISAAFIPTLVLIHRFTSDKEKAFFKKEFASAQEELKRHKKVLHDAKKVEIHTNNTLVLSRRTVMFAGPWVSSCPSRSFFLSN